jgi:hypothetical protein
MSRLVLLCLLALASPAALAYPPCPVAPVVIQNATSTVAPSGVEGGDAGIEGPGPGTDPWMRIASYLVGPEDLIPMLDDDGSKPGECNRVSSSLPLDKKNASDGAILMSPKYAPRSVLGLLELPDYAAVAPAGLQVTYALWVEIDNWPLSAAGDWVDVVQIEVADAGKPQLSGILRLRKVRGREGQRLLLIHSQRGDDTLVTDSRDRILAQWDQPDESSYSFNLSWRQRRTSAALGTHPSGESVDTALELRKSDGSVWVGVDLPDAFLSTLQFGVLDYNAAQPLPAGAGIGLGRLSAVSK